MPPGCFSFHSILELRSGTGLALSPVCAVTPRLGYSQQPLGTDSIFPRCLSVCLALKVVALEPSICFRKSFDRTPS